MDIQQKLQAIQAELKAPKGQYNDYGNYKYRSCEDILEAVKPLCAKNGTVLTLCDDIRQVEGRFYVEACATLTSIESGETIRTTAFAREPESKKGMDESQVTGTASSYARKYALNGLFCIDDTKDADTNAYNMQTGAKPKDAQKKEAKKEQPEHDILCSVCGGKITQANDRGKIIPASEMARRATAKYGQPVCLACAMKINGSQSN